jgi:hypothetical protein
LRLGGRELPPHRLLGGTLPEQRDRVLVWTVELVAMRRRRRETVGTRTVAQEEVDAALRRDEHRIARDGVVAGGDEPRREECAEEEQ